MKQLSARASSFLNFETPTALAHTGSVSLFEPLPDGTPLTAERVRDLFAERIAELPQYRTKLLQVPLGLDRPYWIDDPDFDLEFHIRSMAVPAPGEMAQLETLVARMHARPLDRSRPLWEVYVVDGLADGRVAWYTKTHHACLDSYTGAEIMNALLDRDPDGRREPHTSQWTPERVPGTAEMLGRGLVTLAGRPRAMLRLQRRLVTSAYRQVSSQIPPLLETVAETLDRSSGLVGSRLGKRLASDDYLSRPPLVAPRLSFNRSVSAHRRVAFGSFPLDDLRAIKTWSQGQCPGTTINDVVIAICSGGLRTWLARRAEAPGDPLLALIPVQVAAPAGANAKANDNGREPVGQLAAMIAALPTNESDPAERLRLAHQAMKIAKDDHAAVPAELLAELGDFAPPIIAAGAAQIVSRLGVADMANPRFNVVISNIPGPQRPRYAAGHLQAASFPVPVITDGAGLNITVLSYAGQMHVGLVACRNAVDDLDLLVTDIADALAELVQLTD